MIVRAIAMKNASETPTTCSCTGSTDVTGYPVKDLGGRACDVNLYAGLQILSSTANGIKVYIQNASSSEGGAGSPWKDIAAFTSRTCRDSQWQTIPWNCASATSTHRTFWRAAMVGTCAQNNLWLAAISLD